MGMVTKRRASVQRTAPHSAIALKHTPVASELAGVDVAERYIAATQAEFQGKDAPKCGRTYGRIAALEFNFDVLMEAAFSRIHTLEAELRKFKSLRHKSLDTLQAEQIDDRRIRLAFTNGAEEASVELKFPMLIDRGLWSERAAYDRGDAVTANGGLWVAQTDNPEGKPGSANSGWRLAIKAGRDGKDAR